MNKFVGTKVLKNAVEMNLGKYNDYRGWALPEDENYYTEGYLVIHEDGYESWLPKEAFEKTYVESGGLTFGLAVEAAKRGHKIQRAGWNGTDMFVVYQKGYPDGIPCNANTAKAWGMAEGDLFRCEPYLQIKTTNGSHSMWVPSINDVLANDWRVL